MRVYRVEYPDTHRGPYRSYEPGRDELGSSLSHAHSYYSAGRPHPIPAHTNEGRCACPSMQALFAWFGGWLPLLLRNGAVIAIYDVKKEHILCADGYQVVVSHCAFEDRKLPGR